MKIKLFKCLFVAFIIRFILLLIDQYCIRLPQGGKDTEWFDATAFEMTQSSGIYSIKEIVVSGALLFAYVGSWVYKIFGRHPFIWAFFMLILSLGTIYNIYRGVLLISNNHSIALRSAWIACWFPNLAVLSVLVTREPLIHYFSSLAVFYFLHYVLKKRPRSLIAFLIFAIIASIWHSAMFAMVLGALVYSIFSKNSSFTMKMLVLLLGTITLYYINITGIGLSKFGGSFEQAIELASSGGLRLTEGGSNYPSWLILSGGISDFLIIPLRMIAFLFAPLIPFLVKHANHLIGAIDGGFYFVLFAIVFKNRKKIKRLNTIMAILTMILTITFAFSFGNSNFGTNIRHRAKILPALLMIPIFLKRDSIKKND